jgi:hypothetical protein
LTVLRQSQLHAHVSNHGFHRSFSWRKHQISSSMFFIFATVASACPSRRAFLDLGSCPCGNKLAASRREGQGLGLKCLSMGRHMFTGISPGVICKPFQAIWCVKAIEHCAARTGCYARACSGIARYIKFMFGRRAFFVFHGILFSVYTLPRIDALLSCGFIAIFFRQFSH